MKALIAVELHVDAEGKPTCWGCRLQQSGLFYCVWQKKYVMWPGDEGEGCPCVGSSSDAAVREAEALIEDSIDHGYNDVRLHNALQALHRARE
jgi:hypothetical protein